VKVRGGKAFVALGEGGKLTAFGQTKTGEIPEAVQALAKAKGKTLFLNFEDGKQSAFSNSTLSPKIYEGNPVVGDAMHDGKYSVMLTLPESGNANISYGAPIFIDPAKKYRLSLKMYASEKVAGTVGGYSASRTNAQLKTPEGKVWGWGVGFKGPTGGWKTLEATFGPPGSGAQFILPPEAVSINLTFWCGGTPSPFYVDDLMVEEMK
jgi:hypothetical protein